MQSPKRTTLLLFTAIAENPRTHRETDREKREELGAKCWKLQSVTRRSQRAKLSNNNNNKWLELKGQLAAIAPAASRDTLNRLKPSCLYSPQEKKGLGNCGLLEGPDDYNTTVAKYNQQNGERERERERERGGGVRR
jgi:hypothetical protein